MPSPLPEVDPLRWRMVDDSAVTLIDVHEDDQYVVG